MFALVNHIASPHPFRLFDELSRGFAFERPELSPPGMSADEQGYTLSVDVPGVDPKDLRLSVEGRRLSLSATRTVTAPEGYAAKRLERSELRIERHLNLPEDANPESAEAELKNGVLTVRVTKLEAAKPRQITVK